MYAPKSQTRLHGILPPPPQELRSFTVVMHVEPKHHPNIIGRKGATINRIRDDHDVRIQLPDKDGPNADEITVMGYEHNVKSAENAIQKIVRELVRERRRGEGGVARDTLPPSNHQ